MSIAFQPNERILWSTDSNEYYDNKLFYITTQRIGCIEKIKTKSSGYIQENQVKIENNKSIILENLKKISISIKSDTIWMNWLISEKDRKDSLQWQIKFEDYFKIRKILGIQLENGSEFFKKAEKKEVLTTKILDTLLLSAIILAFWVIGKPTYSWGDIIIGITSHIIYVIIFVKMWQKKFNTIIENSRMTLLYYLALYLIPTILVLNF